MKSERLDSQSHSCGWWLETQGKFWRFVGLLMETGLGGSLGAHEEAVAWCPSSGLSDLARDKAELHLEKATGPRPGRGCPHNHSL